LKSGTGVTAPGYSDAPSGLSAILFLTTNDE